MILAIVSVGYDGTVDETQWAHLVGKAGASEYGVDLAGDFAVSPVSGQDRTVRVAPGKAWGHGVLDTMDVEQTIQFALPASGDRYDMLVLRRDWQPPGGATTLAIVQGSASSVTLPARNTGALGILDDQPIALVRVSAGSTSVSVTADLRVWARNGGCTAVDVLALQYLGALGARVTVGRHTFTRVRGSAGGEWQRSADRFAIQSSSHRYSMPAGEATGPWSRVNFLAGEFVAETTPNVQLTLGQRHHPYWDGRVFVEHKNVSPTGFEVRAVRTTLDDKRERLDFDIHWLATQ